MTQFTLASPEFKEGKTIPKTFTCEGEDISPLLTWQSAPEGVKSFALTCVDPDAPVGDWIHWLVWDIPDTTNELEAAIPPDEQSRLKQGTNSWGRIGYGGPCPPRGHGSHRYYFTLFALDTTSLNLPSSTGITDLKRAMEKHILAKASIMGRYDRR